MSDRVHISLRIEGMTCEGCARHVAEAMNSVPGVEHAQVGSWRVGQATAVVSSDVRDDVMVDAVRKAGYHGVMVERRPLEPTRLVPVSKGRDYDLMTIGGGSAAFAAARQLARRPGIGRTAGAGRHLAGVTASTEASKKSMI